HCLYAAMTAMTANGTAANTPKAARSLGNAAKPTTHSSSATPALIHHGERSRMAKMELRDILSFMAGSRRCGGEAAWSEAATKSRKNHGHGRHSLGPASVRQRPAADVRRHDGALGSTPHAEVPYGVVGHYRPILLGAAGADGLGHLPAHGI